MFSVGWKRAKEYSTLVKNLSTFNQGLLLLSAGQAGEGLRWRILLSGWTSEEEEVKNSLKLCQQMPGLLKTAWNKLWQSFKEEKRSLNSTSFSWPRCFPKRQCQRHLKTLWPLHLYFVTDFITNPTYRTCGLRSVSNYFYSVLAADIICAASVNAMLQAT